MADTKITALTAITTVDPAADVLPIVDVSDTSMAASGTTKKITSNQILGAGGTATLASATISGDLTVDTNTLKVDSANDRVGIGTASPAAPLHIYDAVASSNVITQYQNGTASTQFGVRGGSYGAMVAGDSYIYNGSGNSIVLMADNASGAIKFAAGGSTESMRLNSTGLGVGGSPLDKFTVVGNSFLRGAAAGVRIGDGGGYGFISAYDQTLSTAKDLVLQTGGGNLGIGVTPSAWQSTQRVLQIGIGGALFGRTASQDQVNLAANYYVNSSNNDIYIGNGYATLYKQNLGQHIFYTAPSGTAGNTITFTQAMTLDASGILVVGNTAAASVGVTGGWLASPNSGNSYELIGHNSGSASGSVYSYFFYNSSQIGSITQNGTTGVLYNITSDYRLKESVQPIANGLARVNALKPSIYKWKADGSNGEGFIAHELAEVVPFAVSGEKDAVNEDGSIKPQGIDMSRVVPILVAAIQELTARVQTLETR